MMTPLRLLGLYLLFFYHEELIIQKEDKERKAADIDLFAAEFKKAKCRLTEFDDRLWQTTLEKATVNPDGVISFLFVNGAIVEKLCK